MWIAVEENVELSDPHSYEHYLSGSENKAWNIYIWFSHIYSYLFTTSRFYLEPT